MPQTELEIGKRMDYLHTIDMVVLYYCRQTHTIQVLLNRRQNAPFAQSWALPGLVLNGSVRDVTMDEGVQRLVASSKVGLALAYIEQVATVGDAFRDPRCWSSSTLYLAILAQPAALSDEQKFVSLKSLESRETRLPFDHNELVDKVGERLYSKSLYTSLPLLFLGHEFSAPEATTVYSVVLERPVLKTSIRQRLLKLADEGFVAETGRKKSGEGIKAQATVENCKPGKVFYFDRSFS